MAGRGRGRGAGRGGSMSFSVETLGFGRGEALPGSILQPPPNFPPLEFKPVPLLTGENENYLLALKQEFRGSMQESQFYLKPPGKKKDIERYSDKYQLNSQERNENWEPDWSLLPKELKSTKKRKRVTAVCPVVKPSVTTKNTVRDTIVLKTLEELEKKEQQSDAEEEEEEKQQGENEDIDEEEYYDEEEMEEETDYISSYFDNGEGMDDDDDGLDDGPTY